MRRAAWLGAAAIALAAPGLNAQTFLNFNPDWSPDGAWLVFESIRDGDGEIYRVRPDGSDLERLTDTRADETRPSFFPDGSRIVYDRREGGVWEVWMDPDGRDPRPLVAAPAGADWVAWARHPVVSPDGARVAFDSDRDGNVELYAMELAGGEVVR